MKSTLKVLGILAVLIVGFPTTSYATKKKGGKEDVCIDALSCSVNTYGRKSGVRVTATAVSTRRGRDCGELAAQEATNFNNAGQAVGFIPAPYVSQLAGVLFGFGANDASQRAEAQRWGCLRRDVLAAVGGIKQEIQAEYAPQFAEYRSQIAELQEAVDTLHARLQKLEGKEISEKEAPLPQAPSAFDRFPSCPACSEAPKQKPDAPIAEVPMSPGPEESKGEREIIPPVPLPAVRPGKYPQEARAQ